MSTTTKAFGSGLPLGAMLYGMAMGRGMPCRMCQAFRFPWGPWVASCRVHPPCHTMVWCKGVRFIPHGWNEDLPLEFET